MHKLEFTFFLRVPGNPAAFAYYRKKIFGRYSRKRNQPPRCFRYSLHAADIFRSALSCRNGPERERENSAFSVQRDPTNLQAQSIALDLRQDNFFASHEIPTR